MKRLVITLTALFCLLVPATALAAYNPNPLSGACAVDGGVASSSAACSSAANNPSPIVGPNGALKKVSLILSFVAGTTAVIMILFSGFNYVTSGGDPKKAQDAQSAILGAVIGLVIIAAGETIVVFVVSKL